MQNVTSLNVSGRWLLCDSASEVLPDQQTDILLDVVLAAGGTATEDELVASRHGHQLLATMRAEVVVWIG